MNDEVKRICGLIRWWQEGNYGMDLIEILEFIGNQEDDERVWEIIANIACE